MSQFITTVDRFEGDFAVLKHKDHEILLPIEDLPKNVAEGDFVTIITLSDKKEKVQQEVSEKQAKEKLELLLGDQKKVPEPPKTTDEKIEDSFEAKPASKKIQEVFNDVLSTTLGQEPVYESPEKKEIKELRQISGKMDKVSQNINEEIKEHKTHEEG